MNNWQPIKKSNIAELIGNAEWLLEGIPKDFWKLIKLPEPEEWRQNSSGDKSDDFWVIAVLGKRCIYYDDREVGFNISTYKNWGEIDEYFTSQTDLHQLIESIVNSRFKI